MNDEEITQLPSYSWMESRIPARDALVAFVPEGQECDPVVEATTRNAVESRWYPVPGGHRVLILRGDDSFDTARFTVEPGAWDHETCGVCIDHIKPMTLCWVTVSGYYVLLCVACYQLHVESKLPKRPWWRFW